MIQNPSIDFGLISIGDDSWRQISLYNSSHLPAKWRIRQIDHEAQPLLDHDSHQDGDGCGSAAAAVGRQSGAAADVASGEGRASGAAVSLGGAASRASEGKTATPTSVKGGIGGSGGGASGGGGSNGGGSPDRVASVGSGLSNASSSASLASVVSGPAYDFIFEPGALSFHPVHLDIHADSLGLRLFTYRIIPNERPPSFFTIANNKE